MFYAMHWLKQIDTYYNSRVVCFVQYVYVYVCICIFCILYTVFWNWTEIKKKKKKKKKKKNLNIDFVYSWILVKSYELVEGGGGEVFLWIINGTLRKYHKYMG